MKNHLYKFLTTVCMLLFPCILLAQGSIRGTVTDAETGEPLAAVNIVIAGTEIGTPTNVNGEYELTGIEAGTYEVEARFVGYETMTQSVTVEDGETTVLNFDFSLSTMELDEVVVTSFGLEQERRSLGYSVQEVQSDRIAETRQVNAVSALQGQVSGVQVTNMGGAPGQSSRIIIRGITSLDPSADNQPLFVIDGVPIDNSTIESTGTPRGMSNRAADINPNDIESMNVLKGAAATALYGVRAANGAVIITTKSGIANQTRINVSSTLGFDRVNKFPEFQEVYGQGFGFEVTDNSFWPNWGAKYEDSGLEYHDIWRDAMETGLHFDNTFNVSGGTENATYYASVSNLQQEGVLPFGTWERTSARISGDVSPTSNFKVRSSINFINSGGARVLADRFFESMMYWAPSKDVTDYEKEDGTMKGYYNDGSSGSNPIYQAKYWTYNDDVNRLVGNFTVDYAPLDWFNVFYTIGTDYYSDQRTEILPGPRGLEGELALSSTGFISETRINSRDLNSTLNFTLERQINDKISSRLRLGNDIFDREFNRVFSSGSDFVTPMFYHLSNTRDISVGQQISQRRLVGVYGDLMLDYDDLVYLNVTGRNDWSSTLPEENRSFFYPSLNLGFVFSEALDLPEDITFGKFRASYAVVGKDAPPYSTTDTYFTPGQYPIDGRVGFSRSNIRRSDELKPELTTSIELGTDIRFFDNRFGIDFTWYKSNSKDQIYDVPISNATGYTRTIINAGEIENKGFELQVTAIPVQTRDFLWESTINFSRNKSTVIEIADGIDEILLGSSFGYVGSGASIRLVPGEPFGNIYGNSYARYYENGAPEDQLYLDEDRPLLIGDDGFPIINRDPLVIGNSQPDWVGSIRNSLSYKNINLSFLIDVKWGLDVYSQYDNFFTAFGILENSLNREDMKVFEGFVEVGRDANDNPIYEENTQEVWLGQGVGPDGVDYGAGYHRNVARLATEDQVKDASYIKLRNISLSYSLPNSTIDRLGMRGITLSATATNIILYTPFEGFDPESRGGGASSNADGFTQLMYPGVASGYFSINLSF